VKALIRMTDEEPEYGLVMPFVTVASKGGPHDDAAYVAGWEMGALDEVLDLADGIAVSVDRTIRAENREQADLIAMKHGFRAEFDTDDEHPEWVHVRFEANR
jgi:hypothetical protein